jgi:hypothetical protein
MLTELAPPADPGRAVVVLGVESTTTHALLERTRWAKVRRICCAEQGGSHEAAGGIAVGVAAAMVASDPSVDVALSIGSARGSGYVIVLRRGAAA